MLAAHQLGIGLRGGAVSAGSIALASSTPTNINLSTGYLDWIIIGGNTFASGNLSARKYNGTSDVALITIPTLISPTVDNNTLSGFVTLSWTGDGDPGLGGGATGSVAAGRSTNVTTAVTNGIQLTAPANLTSHFVDIWFCGIQFSGGVDSTVTATLSDGSYAPQSLNIPNGGSNKFNLVRATFNAASAGQTMTIQILGTTAIGAEIGFAGAAYQ